MNVPELTNWPSHFYNGFPVGFPRWTRASDNQQDQHQHHTALGRPRAWGIATWCEVQPLVIKQWQLTSRQLRRRRLSRRCRAHHSIGAADCNVALFWIKLSTNWRCQERYELKNLVLSRPESYCYLRLIPLDSPQRMSSSVLTGTLVLSRNMTCYSSAL